jgi:SAM-dependent methyltransferase
VDAEASSNDQRLDQVRRAALVEWEAMAPGWERRREYLREFSQGVTDWMVARLDPQPGQTILELGAGTGETGFAAASLIGGSGRLISTDLPPGMVEVAKRRARELGVENAEFRVTDAEHIDLESGSVDGVLCRWAYMLMPDPAAAAGREPPRAQTRGEARTRGHGWTRAEPVGGQRRDVDRGSRAHPPDRLEGHGRPVLAG